jgi:hypothetical protein
MYRFGSSPPRHHGGDKPKPPPPACPGLKTPPAASASPKMVMANPYKKKNPVPAAPPHPTVAVLQNPYAKQPFQTAMTRTNPHAKLPPTMMYSPCVKDKPAIPTIVSSPVDFIPSEYPSDVDSVAKVRNHAKLKATVKDKPNSKRRSTAYKSFLTLITD